MVPHKRNSTYVVSLSFVKWGLKIIINKTAFLFSRTERSNVSPEDKSKKKNPPKNRIFYDK